MKANSLAIIWLALIAFTAAHNLNAYRWAVENKSNREVSVQVCTSPGIDHCQDKIIGPDQTHSFDFDKWYNSGLCLGEIKLNGNSVPISNEAGEHFVMAVLSLGTGNILKLMIDRCSNGNLVVTREFDGGVTISKKVK